MMIKVLVKEPGKLAALREIENSLKSAQSIVGGYIEIVAVYHDPRIIMFCDEEGKLKGLEVNLSHGKDLIVGPVFFARSDDEGDTAGLEDGDLEIIQGLTGIEVKTN